MHPMTITAQHEDTGVITHHLEDDMFENTHWVWFVLGLIPYRADWKPVRAGWQLTIEALFWSLTLTRQTFKRKRKRTTRTHWSVRVPFIIKLREAVWSAVMSLRDSE
jgi:hypothetical protein